MLAFIPRYTVLYNTSLQF